MLLLFSLTPSALRQDSESLKYIHFQNERKRKETLLKKSVQRFRRFRIPPSQMYSFPREKKKRNFLKDRRLINASFLLFSSLHFILANIRCTISLFTPSVTRQRSREGEEEGSALYSQGNTPILSYGIDRGRRALAFLHRIDTSKHIRTA